MFYIAGKNVSWSLAKSEEERLIVMQKQHNN